MQQDLVQTLGERGHRADMAGQVGVALDALDRAQRPLEIDVLEHLSGAAPPRIGGHMPTAGPLQDRRRRTAGEAGCQVLTEPLDIRNEPLPHLMRRAAAQQQGD